jgi:hypothetical protein
MPEWLAQVFAVLPWLLPGVLWCIWWLWGVNWKRAWPTLAQGGWAPVLLLMAVATMAWSRLQPGPCGCLGFVTIPNVWWQLGSVCALVAAALFCGWLQGYFGWAPPEYSLEPPPVHGNGHDHAFAHTAEPTHDADHEGHGHH